MAELLTIDEAAVELGKSARQVRYMVKQGKLPATKIAGRWRIARSALPRSGGQRAAADRRLGGLRDTVDRTLGTGEKPRRYSIRDLKAFEVGERIRRDAIEQLGGDDPLVAHLRDVLVDLAQGCHRFRSGAKAESYRSARDRAAALACDAYLRGGPASSVAQSVEADLMPALAGLLRQVE